MQPMPTSFEPVEDIFADTAEPAAAPIEPTVAPIAEVPLAAPRRSYRRLIWMIASCTLALLLLGGIGLGVWFWLNRPVVDETIPPMVNTIPDTTLNTNVVVNANSVVPSNVNTTPSFVDVDHDGLSDDEELVVNTNPKKKDTDEDGLSDREEVRVYGTDPRNTDTDADGYTDGDEVTHFYHPNSPDPKKRLFDLP